jgi:hypothetical protein
MKPLGVNKTTSAMAVAALVFGLSVGNADHAAAQPADDVPMMTIKIFNDDPKYTVFPVLTTGKRLSENPPRDIWLQAFFKVPKNDIEKKTYRSELLNRIYLNPLNGIKPGESVTLRLPLFTQRVETVSPDKPDQYISWWNGSVIHLYYSDTGSPPKALEEALAKDRPGRIPLASLPDVAVRPRCPDCVGRLNIYNPPDNADLPKNDPHQLLEFTLGARIDLEPVKNPATDPPNGLDLKNVDFDVSYVNVAYGPAAMGPFGNDQVGYVGTPQTVDEFRGKPNRNGKYTNGLNQFLQDFPGWPQFVRGNETLLKLASPLEVFARLSAKDPPPDLTPPPQWPDKLWVPIQALRDNWVKYAGKVNADGTGVDGICKAASPQVDPIVDFCDAIVNLKKLMLANYKKYQTLFPSPCTGTAVELSDDLLIAHAYGWTPFTEAVEDGQGCGPRDNLLQNTPGYFKDVMVNGETVRDYSEYRRVKLSFDRLNYAKLQSPQYVFNPWVVLIHGRNTNRPYLNTPNAYAYSVDDAVGNIQALATGIIIDVGSTKNLENQEPASPPINIALGFSPLDTIRFTRYRLCKNDKAHEKPVIPTFPGFVISANNPKTCPIFLFDNKSLPQLYTFTITQEPPYKVFADSDLPRPDWNTADRPFDCSGNKGPQPPYRPSSATWCCDQSTSSGLFAYSKPDLDNAHGSLQHIVSTKPAQADINTRSTACLMGQ